MSIQQKHLHYAEKLKSARKFRFRQGKMQFANAHLNQKLNEYSTETYALRGQFGVGKKVQDSARKNAICKRPSQLKTK